MDKNATYLWLMDSATGGVPVVDVRVDQSSAAYRIVADDADGRTAVICETDDEATAGVIAWCLHPHQWRDDEPAKPTPEPVTCTGCELADDCPGFADCPRLAAAKAEGER